MISTRKPKKVEAAAFFRAAFKHGRRVNSALQREMLKSPIAHFPAILLGYINRPSGETDSVYEVNAE